MALPATRPEALTLEAYLRAGARCRWAWGENDCLTWIADWAWAMGWPDPAAPFRGRYASAAAALRLVRREGGMLAVARAGAARAGLVEIDPAEAQPGDIGLGFMGESEWPGEPGGLIRAGAYWAGLTAALRVVIGEARMVAAWKVV